MFLALVNQVTLSGIGEEEEQARGHSQLRHHAFAQHRRKGIFRLLLRKDLEEVLETRSGKLEKEAVDPPRTLAAEVPTVLRPPLPGGSHSVTDHEAPGFVRY